ncbi:Hypothetical_protein [Hexamita inflata]|uniref:Hypothetical_protein n=1 Tax=Hexamita inflata TaxID=28002 RepID=A0AA86R854_9EUKA|nr:Hypothetical protein HINF_LOCUS55612 [Hexamita inflata]
MKCYYNCRYIPLGALLFVCSPFIIIFLLFQYIVIVPIEKIIILKIAKQHSKESAEQNSAQQTIESENQVNSHIELDDLMFLTKLNYFNLYLSFQNGSICLLDQNQKCLSQKQIQYYFEPNKTQKYFFCVHFKKFFESSVGYKSIKTGFGFLNNSIVFNNKIYFTYFDFVYVSDGITVQIVGQIPNYIHHFKSYVYEQYSGGMLFTLNGKLYVHNHSKYLYQIINNKLKLVNRSHKNKYYYQFCDKTYCIQQNGIYSVQNNNLKKLELILKVDQMKILFNCGGTLIVNGYSEYQTHVVILNMLDGEIKPVMDQYQKSMIHFDLQKLLTLGLTGVQLKDQILNDYFGQDFTYRLTQYYQNYQLTNWINYSYNQLIQNIHITFTDAKELYLKKFGKVALKIQLNQTRVTESINALVQVQNLMINSYQLEPQCCQ